MGNRVDQQNDLSSLRKTSRPCGAGGLAVENWPKGRFAGCVGGKFLAVRRLLCLVIFVAVADCQQQRIFLFVRKESVDL